MGSAEPARAVPHRWGGEPADPDHPVDPADLRRSCPSTLAAAAAQSESAWKEREAEGVPDRAAHADGAADPGHAGKGLRRAHRIMAGRGLSRGG